MKTTKSFIVALVLLACSPLHAAALTPDQQALHVLNRLGYGPRPGDVERVTQMGVQRYIDAQLHPESIPLPQDLTARLAANETANRSAGDALGEYNELRKEVRDEEEGAKQRRRAALAKATRETAEARLLSAIDSPRQLEEVMVDFWFNHFNVFVGKGIDRALIASYERDAIRPYALGSFRDLLGATAKHPAMLFYLDNVVSTSNEFGAEQAKKGAKGPRGLNENYARELMELHTLGVDGGYTQKDVTELARMLTGWTFQPQRLVRFNETFRFDSKRHDQGVKTWLGRTVEPGGQREGEMALDVLAVHPATARHVSYQLAQYFVSDAPPSALVERMAKTWIETRGDIRSVLRTLFASDEFMAPQAVGAKFKTPYQFVVSAVRASGVPVKNVQPLLGTMSQLGMPLYGCQTPDGYKNTQDAWLNPDALTRRITFATALGSGRIALSAPPPDLQQMQAMSASAALPARAVAQGEQAPPMGTVAPAQNPPMVTNTVSAQAMAAAAASQPPLDASRLLSTLDGGISQRTLDTLSHNPPELRAAMVLGSPDFMQH
ncbi:DUF1800 domain-containing protein [Massilia solisilvae]|uniref:DUF1800 domain-containing protein n=1 Tax=Massilia solisilvae TaxID=1811225 RepID=A0ABT2BEI7_9BURK|nr:DUF1800 domain-containing protein [Massilia solisilvae]MCS0606826.1 DUF1800 domain-containing protein [Massilia solisilvae]